MSIVIICKDNILSRLIEIELLFKHSDLNIIKLTDPNEISQNVQDDKNIIIADFDCFDTQSANLLPQNCAVISFGRENPEQYLQSNVFLHRPFSLAELCKKVSMFLNTKSDIISALNENKDNISLFDEKFMAVINGKVFNFSETEFSILKTLYENKNKTVSRSMLSKLIKSNKANSVEVYICMLRRKIDNPFDSRYIRTIRGEGYMFCCCR